MRLYVTVSWVEPPAGNVPDNGDTANGAAVPAAQVTACPPGFDNVTASALADVPKSIVAVDSTSWAGDGAVVVVWPGTMNGCVVDVVAGGSVAGGAVTGGSVTGGMVTGGATVVVATGRIVVAVVAAVVVAGGGSTAKTEVDVDDVDEVVVDDVDEVLVDDGVLEVVVVETVVVVVAGTVAVVAGTDVVAAAVVTTPNVVDVSAGARYSGSSLAASRYTPVPVVRSKKAAAMRIISASRPPNRAEAGNPPAAVKP